MLVTLSLSFLWPGQRRKWPGQVLVSLPLKKKFVIEM